MDYTQLSLFGKTCPEPLAATKARTSGVSLKNSAKSKHQELLFLDLRRGSGGMLGASWETNGALPGVSWMPNFGECPSVAVESRLSWILEDNPHPKYFLSETATAGILRRAKKRGKELPPLLANALLEQVVGGNEDGKKAVAACRTILHKLWKTISSESVGDWFFGIDLLVQPAEVLQFKMSTQMENGKIQSQNGRGWTQCGPEDIQARVHLRGLWRADSTLGNTSYRQESIEQFEREFSGIVQRVPRETASPAEILRYLWETSSCERTVQYPLSTAIKSRKARKGTAAATETGVGAAGVVSKGNGDCFLTEERHMSLTTGGGQAGQGYPCVLAAEPVDTPSYAVRMREGCLTPWDSQTQRIYSVDSPFPSLFANSGGGQNRQAILEPDQHAVAFKAGQGASARSIGLQNECSPTLSSDAGGNTVPAVVYTQKRFGEYAQGIGTLTAQCGRTAVSSESVICMATGQANAEITEDISLTLSCAHEQPIAASQYRVRRLTPLEAERLQGFPDGWTNIPDYTDDKGKNKKVSDSARYKALGNSIALPPWRYVLGGISERLHPGATLGSLFDGISGFPKVWSEIHGKEACVWSSEVEPFCVAVTKYHFGDK